MTLVETPEVKRRDLTAICTYRQYMPVYTVNLYRVHERFYICCFKHPVSARSFPGEILRRTGSDALNVSISSSGGLFEINEQYSQR